MRTAIIFSSICLGGVLALASVQAAEQAPAQANAAVVVTLQNVGGTTQAAVTQQGDAAIAVSDLSVQVQTAAAPAAEEAPAAAQSATPAPPAAAPAAAPAPAGMPAGTRTPAPATARPATGAPQPAMGAPGMQRPFDASAAGRRRFQPRGQGQPVGQPMGFSRQGPTVTGAGPAASPQATPFDTYQVLAQRNIFSRVRGVPQGPRTPPPPPPPQRYLVLKGVLGGENGYVAFIEDTRTGDTSHSQAGDVVGQGRITAVGPDGLTYDQNGKATKVAIGDYVGGAPPAGSAPATAAAPEAASSGAASDVLERLRQRRLKEEGK